MSTDEVATERIESNTPTPTAAARHKKLMNRKIAFTKKPLTVAMLDRAADA